MSANGHVLITPGEIARILDEWSDAIKDAKEALHDDILKDSRFFQECELDMLVTYIIPDSFATGSGSVPDGIEKNDDRLWNYPEFARIIIECAKISKISTKILINRAFGFLVRHEDDGRVKVLNILLGEEYVRRVIGDRDVINRISKRRKPDRSDDPKELKTISTLTSNRAQ